MSLSRSAASHSSRLSSASRRCRAAASSLPASDIAAAAISTRGVPAGSPRSCRERDAARPALRSAVEPARPSTLVAAGCSRSSSASSSARRCGPPALLAASRLHPRISCSAASKTSSPSPSPSQHARRAQTPYAYMSLAAEGLLIPGSPERRSGATYRIVRTPPPALRLALRTALGAGSSRTLSKSAKCAVACADMSTFSSFTSPCP
mmetsp:Transcript_32212/g.107511  ORF Transcript_32212/g.107511 Transcript_32212/m.107511 type:complete len:207 (+) Transcript_32212:334-954(+)